MFEIKQTAAWCKEVDEDPQPTWLFKDMIRTASAIQMTGKAKKAWKTWMAMLMSMSLASGKRASVWDPVRPTGVLFIEVEGPRKPTRDRFLKLENGFGLSLGEMPRHYMMHRQRFQLEEKKHIDELTSFVTEQQIGLVVLDTFIKVSKGDENDARSIDNAMKGVEAFMKKGAAVLYVHHVGKPNDNRNDVDDQTRGSSAFAGHFDHHIAIRTTDTPSLNVTLINKDDEEKYFKAAWHIDKNKNAAYLDMDQVDSFGETDAPDIDQCKNLILSGRSQWYNVSALTRAWKIDDKNTVYDLANRLVDEGFLEVSRNGQKWRKVL